MKTRENDSWMPVLPRFPTLLEIMEAKVWYQEKNRNLAKVHYEKMNDGTFKIVALEGFLSDDDIFVQHGKRVWDRYSAQEHAMAKNHPDQVSFKTARLFVPEGLTVGQVYTKEEFSASIAEAKLCGSTLCQIIKEVKDGTRVIEI